MAFAGSIDVSAWVSLLAQTNLLKMSARPQRWLDRSFMFGSGLDDTVIKDETRTKLSLGLIE
jgi:hypothetical protein